MDQLPETSLLLPAFFAQCGHLGIAKCRAYDRSRTGVEYVTKCLSQGTLGANDYELRKFNLADAVTLSRCVTFYNTAWTARSSLCG
jgi:hypothetical protein